MIASRSTACSAERSPVSAAWNSCCSLEVELELELLLLLLALAMVLLLLLL